MAVPYAVSRKLIDSARIRHDFAVMYVALKGDDKEYYVDLKVDKLKSLVYLINSLFLVSNSFLWL